MKKGHVYTFLFMVLIAAVLTFALAAAYEGFKPAIEQNAALQEQRAVLYALGLDEGLEDELPELPQQPANSAATSTSARVRTKVFLGKIQTPFRLPADAGRRAGRSL